MLGRSGSHIDSSMSALSGESPVPPAMKIRWEVLARSRTREPRGGPSLMVSPGRVWWASAVLTHPPDTTRTWKVSRLSRRCALAIEYGRHTLGQ